MKATLKPSDLPEGHPAITKNRRWTAAAKRVLNRPIIRTRYRAGENIAPRENPVRNTKLFNAIANYLEVFPEAWEQSFWGKIKSDTPCGTAFCIAGTAAHEAGWMPDFDFRNVDLEKLIERADLNRYDTEVSDYNQEAWQNVTRPKGDESIDIQDVAAFELGLTVAEREFLFSSDMHPRAGYEIHDVLRLIGRGEPLENLIYDSSDSEEDGYFTGLAVDELKAEYANGHKIRITGDKG